VWEGTQKTSHFKTVSNSLQSKHEKGVGTPFPRVPALLHLCSTRSLDDHWAAFPWCSQQNLSRQSFVGHYGHMAEPTSLGYLDSEKWFEIQGFTNFTAAHFVVKV